MRTRQHIIDSKTIKKVLRLIPNRWVVRDLSERDYGVDLQLEIFSKMPGKPADDPEYESTGSVALLQLKGTETPLKLSPRDGTLHAYPKIKALRYAERFATPFFWVRADVSSAAAPCYFLWVQRYILEVLDVKRPNWRTLHPEYEIPVRIPADNTLTGKRMRKIEGICDRPKYLEELVEFAEMYSILESKLDAISHGQHPFNAKIHQYLISLAQRITHYRTLLARNSCCVDADSAAALLAVVRSLKPSHPAVIPWVRFGERVNFGLLMNAYVGMLSLEQFSAEWMGTTTY
jgi:Domain of unknown function (DUF4365)